VHKPAVWPVFVTFVAAAVAIMVAGVAIVVVDFAGKTRQAAPERSAFGAELSAETLNRSAIASELVLLAAVGLAARPLTRGRLRLVRGRSGLATTAAVALGTLAVGDVVDSAAMLLGLYRTGALAQMRQAIEGARGATLVTTFLVVGLLAGFAEELFFRGFMQTRLSQRWRLWPAVLATSLCFGLMHLDAVHSTEAFFIGLWLGWATERTGSLWPAVAGHVLNNSLSVLFQVLGLVSEAARPNLIWGAAGAVLLVGCLIALRRLPAPRDQG
jgi:membrane protease YdiL (CAAX protease family)